MILKLRNIGRFHKETSIDINGITVLVGTNGTGKSTIGKTLYCVFIVYMIMKIRLMKNAELQYIGILG